MPLSSLAPFEEQKGIRDKIPSNLIFYSLSIIPGKTSSLIPKTFPNTEYLTEISGRAARVKICMDSYLLTIRGERTEAQAIA